jgi:two-component system cell cycle response regulator DivK
MTSSEHPALVLLVQPERDDRDMYAEFLRRHGYAAVAVSTAAEALTIGPRADVIVTALLLPGDTDGVEFIARLRRLAPATHTPVIVVTACAWQSDFDRAVAAGCDAFLAKPCAPETLLSEIRRTLSLHRLARPRWIDTELACRSRLRRRS